MQWLIPLVPPKTTEVIWSKKILKQILPVPHPSHIQCSTPYHQCPYSRSHHAKSSNTQFSPISEPPPPTEICLNKLLMHLVSINGNPHNTTEDHCNTPLEPLSPSTITSTQSPHSSSPITTSSESESESTSCQSTLSNPSDRQLHPHLPLRTNKTFLMRLQGRPQVKVIPTLSIPLPESSSDSEEEDMDTT